MLPHSAAFNPHPNRPVSQSVGCQGRTGRGCGKLKLTVRLRLAACSHFCRCSVIFQRFNHFLSDLAMSWVAFDSGFYRLSVSLCRRVGCKPWLWVSCQLRTSADLNLPPIPLGQNIRRAKFPSLAKDLEILGSKNNNHRSDRADLNQHNEGSFINTAKHLPSKYYSPGLLSLQIPAHPSEY